MKRGKDSLKDPHAYAEFRNLVLEYAQRGGDAEARKKIDAIVATFGSSAPARTEQKPESSRTHEPHGEAPVPHRGGGVAKEEKHPFGVVGTRRIGPRFQVPVVKEEVPAPAPAPIPEPKPIPEPAPVPEPVPVPPPSPVPEPAPVSEPVLPTPKPTPEVVTPSPSVQFKTLDEYKARIAEIKRLVNAQVGNPATLIDTHNDTGKRYMTALLSALKASGGGGEGIDGAMAKLEEAFSALIERDTEHDVAVAESKVAIAEESSVARWEGSNETAVVPEAPVLRDVPDVSEAVVHGEEAPKPVSPEELVPNPAVVREPQEAVLERADEKITAVVERIAEQRPRASLSALLMDEVEDATPPPEAPEPSPNPAPAPLTPLSSQKSPVGAGGSWPASRQVLRGIGRKTPEEVKAETGIDTGEVKAKQTELSSPEITATLNQLLNEWSIFHGSGFFGMGPSGPEHPLYKTLAPLSMGEVIAGRWEGGNPKLTKTVKQYVDAWRHEQGIAYVIDETFEHYLRRVVQRIMKRQGGGAI